MFLTELASKGKLNKFLQGNGQGNVREVLLDRCRPIGILRYVSDSQRLNLKFKGLVYKNFINRESLLVDVKKLITQVLVLTDNSELKTHEVEKIYGRLFRIRKIGRFAVVTMLLN